MIRRQAHFLPGLQRRSVGGPAAAGGVLLERLVVEQVEPDQLHALIFEIDQRAIDAALVAVQNVRADFAPIGLGTEIAGGPITRPVHPGCAPLRDRLVAAPAQRMVLADLAEKAIRPLGGQRAQSEKQDFGAGSNNRQIVFGACRRIGETDRHQSHDAGRPNHRPSHVLLLRVPRMPPSRPSVRLSELLKF